MYSVEAWKAKRHSRSINWKQGRIGFVIEQTTENGKCFPIEILENPATHTHTLTHAQKQMGFEI